MAKKSKKIEKVMHEFKEKELHSGSKKGPLVKNPSGTQTSSTSVSTHPRTSVAIKRTL